MGFLTSANDAVKGKALNHQCSESNEIKSILEVLSTFDKWIDEIPPIDQPQRFGNKAYRIFYDKLKEVILNFCLCLYSEIFIELDFYYHFVQNNWWRMCYEHT